MFIVCIMGVIRNKRSFLLAASFAETVGVKVGSIGGFFSSNFDFWQEIVEILISWGGSITDCFSVAEAIVEEVLQLWLFKSCIALLLPDEGGGLERTAVLLHPYNLFMECYFDNHAKTFQKRDQTALLELFWSFLTLSEVKSIFFCWRRVRKIKGNIK